MNPTHYRLIDRLPVPALAALSRTWPDVLAGLARDVPAVSAGWGWERPREVDRIMRMPPVGAGRRTA